MEQDITKHSALTLPPGKLLTTGEAAAYLGFSPKAVREWSDLGLIAHLVTPGGRRRYRVKDLDAAKARWSK